MCLALQFSASFDALTNEATNPVQYFCPFLVDICLGVPTTGAQLHNPIRILRSAEAIILVGEIQYLVSE